MIEEAVVVFRGLPTTAVTLCAPSILAPTAPDPQNGSYRISETHRDR